MEEASETMEKVESSRSMEHSPSKSSFDSASEASDQPDRTDPSNASPNPLKDVDFLQVWFGTATLLKCCEFLRFSLGFVVDCRWNSIAVLLWFDSLWIMFDCWEKCRKLKIKVHFGCCVKRKSISSLQFDQKCYYSLILMNCNV